MKVLVTSYNFNYLPVKVLSTLVERNWREIVNREYQFQRLFIEADAIEKVKLADVMGWIENHFPTGNKTLFRKLSVQIVGNKPKDDNAISTGVQPKKYDLQYLDACEPIGDSHENSADFIKDIEQFKNNLPIINVTKIELAQC